jgi:hypothetical protein
MAEERPPSEDSPNEGNQPTEDKVQKIDASDIPAPSIGPDTVIEREPPEQRLARHQPSDVDAMGKDKRRQVVGHAYGPSRRQQLVFFGIVGAVILVVWVGAKILVSQFDTTPETFPDKAPWS